MAGGVGEGNQGGVKRNFAALKTPNKRPRVSGNPQSVSPPDLGKGHSINQCSPPFIPIKSEPMDDDQGNNPPQHPVLIETFKHICEEIGRKSTEVPNCQKAVNALFEWLKTGKVHPLDGSPCSNEVVIKQEQEVLITNPDITNVLSYSTFREVRGLQYSSR